MPIFGKKKRPTYGEYLEEKVKELEEKVATLTYDITELYQEKAQAKVTELNRKYATHMLLDWCVNLKSDGYWGSKFAYRLKEDDHTVYEFDHVEFKGVYNELCREPVENAIKVYCYDKQKKQEKK